MVEEKDQKHTVVPGPIELAKEAWEIYKKRFWIVVGVFFLGMAYIVGYVGISAILGVILGFIFQDHLNIFSFAIFAIIGLAFLFGLFFLANLIQAAYILVIRDWKKATGVRATLTEARRFALPLLFTSLLSGILIFGGMILLVIPGILLSVWLSFVSYTVVCEGKSGMQAIHASRELFRGRFWGMLGRSIVIRLPEVVVSFVIAWLIAGKVFPPEVNILYQVISILLVPFYFAYTFLLYSYAQKARGDIKQIPPYSKRFYIIFPIIGYILLILGLIFILPTAYKSASQAIDRVLNQSVPGKIKPGTAIVYGLVSYYGEHNKFPESLDALKGQDGLSIIPGDALSGKEYRYTVTDNGGGFKLCTPEGVTPEKCLSETSKDFDL